MDWEFGISRCKLLCVEMDKQQGSIITESFCCTAEINTSLGLPWQSSGLDSMLLMQGVQV